MTTDTAEHLAASASDDDPSADRMMLAIQYATALIAALAAGLLSLIH